MCDLLDDAHALFGFLGLQLDLLLFLSARIEATVELGNLGVVVGEKSAEGVAFLDRAADERNIVIDELAVDLARAFSSQSEVAGSNVKVRVLTAGLAQEHLLDLLPGLKSQGQRNNAIDNCT